MTNPRPIPPTYDSFLSAAMYHEDFRQALLDAYRAPENSGKWKVMKDQLIGKGICTEQDVKKFLDKIVQIDWNPIYEMEQILGREPDVDDHLKPMNA